MAQQPSMATMHDILSGCISQDNSTRQQAEQALAAAGKKKQLIPAVLECLARSNDDAVRPVESCTALAFCSLLLRQMGAPLGCMTVVPRRQCSSVSLLCAACLLIETCPASCTQVAGEVPSMRTLQEKSTVDLHCLLFMMVCTI